MFSRLHHRRPRKDKEKDVEASGAGHEGASSSSANDADNDRLGEYPALDRYISTYRDESLREDDTESKGRGKTPWWKFWKFQDDQHPTQSGGPTIPEEWYSTDIKTGIRSDQIEERRKLTGWNELTAEKENMFAKVLGYFQGPILYGLWRLNSFSHHSPRSVG